MSTWSFSSALARGGVLAAIVISAPSILAAQGTAADYARADSLTRRFQNLVANVAERPVWIDATRFWYRKSVVGGNSFVLVDTRTATRTAAFDHTKLSASLNALTSQRYTPITLPFSEITFDGTMSVRFAASGSVYSCTLAEYTCVRTGVAPSATFGAGAGRGGNPFFAADDEQPTETPWVEDDGLEAEVFAQRANAARFCNNSRARRNLTPTLRARPMAPWKRTSGTTTSLCGRCCESKAAVAVAVAVAHSGRLRFLRYRERS